MAIRISCFPLCGRTPLSGRNRERAERTYGQGTGYLKQITDRVGVTHTIPADIQSSKEKFKEFLLMERGRELFMEGWRRQDLIRFGKYIEFARNRGCTAAKDHMVLFPIPPKGDYRVGRCD